MTYSSDLLALGPVAYWPLDDVVGATLVADQGTAGQTATVPIASPGVISTPAPHGFLAGDPVVFSTTGALPTGIVAGTTYFVIAAGLTSTAFEIATTAGGTAINATGSQSGVHTVTRNHTLIKNGTITLASTGFVDGIGSSMQVASSSMAYRDPAVGSSLDLTTALTMCGWFALDGGLPSGSSAGLFNRNNGPALRMTPAGALSAQSNSSVGVPAGYSQFAGLNGAVQAGDIVFAALAWSLETGIVKLVLNGVLHGTFVRDIAFPSNSGSGGRWSIGTSGETHPAFRAAGVALFNKELSVGVLRDLCIDNASFARAAFGQQHEPPATVATRGAGIDGGKLSTDGSRVTTATGKTYRPDQYAGGANNTPAVALTTGNWQAQAPVQIAKTIREFAVMATQRGVTLGAAGGSYMDSSGILHSPQFTGDDFQTNWTVMEMMSGVAQLQRWSKAPADSTMVRIASALMEQVIAGQAPTGRLVAGAASSVSDFVFFEMTWTALMLRGSVPAATLARWVTALIAHYNYISGPLGDISPGYYINGNRELQMCAGLYALYMLTGDPAWLTKYNTQWSKTVAPSNAISSVMGPAGTAGYGLKNGTVRAQGTVTTTSGSDTLTALNVTSGTFSVGQLITGAGIPGGAVIKALPDASTIQIAYAGGTTLPATATASGVAVVSHDGSLVASPSTLDPVTGRAFLAESAGAGATAGLDWDYLTNQIAMMQRLWAMTKDATHWKILSAMTNKFMERLNTTTWNFDATGGSRHSFSTTTYAHFVEALIVSGLRPDLTTDCSTHWPISRNLLVGGTHGQGLNQHRDLAGLFGGALLFSPQWPGIPA